MVQVGRAARPFLSFGAFVDNKCSVTLDDGRKCLVLPSITYDELLAPVRA